MPLLTERELRKMSVRPIVSLCVGGLGAGVLFLPVLIVAGAVSWWMIGWMAVCALSLIASLVYVHRG